MLQFILGAAKSGKTEIIYKLLAERATSGDDSVLFVPEQLSYETERALLQRLGDVNAARVNVLSFSSVAAELKRLYGGSCGKTVTDTTRLIILQKLLRKLGTELQLFKDAGNATSALGTVWDAVVEMKTEGLTSERLLSLSEATDNELLKMKLHDIGLIIAAYDAELRGVYIDPLDDLDIALRLARDNGYFKGKAVFFDGYNGFSGQQYKFINQILIDAESAFAAFDNDGSYGEFGVFSNINDTIAKLKGICKRQGRGVAKPVILTETHYKNNNIARFAAFIADKSKLFENCEGIKIVKAANSYKECEYVARTVRKLARETGAHYRDFAIVARNTDDYADAAAIAFERLGVPLYIDEKQPYLSMQLPAFVLFALSASRSFKTSDIMQWLKTDLTDFDPDALEITDNYVYLWNIDGDDWLNDWQNNPYGLKEMPEERVEKKLSLLNGYRRDIVNKLIPLARLKRASATELCKALFDFLSECKVDKKLCETADYMAQMGKNSIKQFIVASWGTLCDILDGIVECYGDEELSFGEFYEILKICFENTALSGIPQSIDTVTLTAADRFVPTGAECVFLVGANYGVFPSVSTDTGFFTVTERGILNGMQAEIANRYIDACIQENCFFYRAAASPESKLYITYCIGDIKGEEKTAAKTVAYAKKLLNIPVLSADNEPCEFETPDDAFAAACDSSEGAYRAAVFDTLSACEAFGERIERISAYSPKSRAISPETAKKLYNSSMNISPSKVEQFYKCPYAYFLKYGLKIRVREQIDFKRMQRGTIAHFVLQKILQNHFDTLSPEDYKTISQLVVSYINLYLAVTVGNEYTPDGEAQYLLERIAETLCELLPEILTELKLSCFKPQYFELELSQESDCKPLVLNGEDFTVTLGGTVDRVDTFKADGHIYLRVVDYKTGKKMFALPDILYGLNLQMLVYMCAICESKPDLFRPAAVIYQPINPIKREGISATEKEKQKPKGVLTDDAEMLKLIDPTESYMPFKLKKDGTPQKNDICISLEDFYSVFDFLKAKIRQMAKSLRDGVIENTPCNSGSGKVCEYCDYRTVCRRSDEDESITVEKAARDEVISIIRGEG